MINDFTIDLYHDRQKIDSVLGPVTSENELFNARVLFTGKNSNVFHKMSSDTRFPDVNGVAIGSDTYKGAETNLVLSPNGQTTYGLRLSPVFKHGPSAYPLEYKNNSISRKMKDGTTFYTEKNYFSVDFMFIISVSKSMTDLDFSNYEGEALRILKAWIHLMSYGDRDKATGALLVRSPLNEYGEPKPPRVMHRAYKSTLGDEAKKQGYIFAESEDHEWALTPDDYSKVAALDYVFSKLVSEEDIHVSSTPMLDAIQTTQENYVGSSFIDKIDGRNMSMGSIFQYAKQFK